VQRHVTVQNCLCSAQGVTVGQPLTVLGVTVRYRSQLRAGSCSVIFERT